MRFVPFFLVLSLCLFTACDFTGVDDRNPPRELTGSEAEIADASGSFGLKLLRTVHDQDAGENIFISPLSVSMALGMTLNGAEGDTRTEMEEVLELAGLSRAEINQSYQSLIELLTGMEPRVTMKIANSIWAREGFPVEQNFINTNEEYFNARVDQLNFDDPQAADVMNAWVKGNTEGLIDEIVEPPIDPNVVMYLINAIYFQGDWTYQFDPADTESEPFYLDDASEVEVDMMKLDETDLHMYRESEVTAVDLPYGDGYYSMTLLLPPEGQDMASFIGGLDNERWQQIDSGLTEATPMVHLPKFEIEYEKGLVDVLKAMGMEAAFMPARSDFTGINKHGDDLYISDVQHISYVSVDEEGTEAAAATSVEIGVVSVPQPIQFNRPFAFFIRDHHSGSIIFAGTLVDPTR